MARSKHALVSTLVLGAVCLSLAVPDPLVAFNDAKDEVLKQASTATSKSRFSAGRSLLQEPTSQLNDVKDEILKQAATAVSKSRFPVGRSLLRDGNNFVDRAAQNAIKINDGMSAVANAAQRITSSLSTRKWVTRHLLGQQDVPATEDVAARIADDVYNMNFETQQAMAGNSRKLLEEEEPAVIPAPKIVTDKETTSSLDKNKATINNSANQVSSLFDRIASRARFGSTPSFGH